MPRPGTFVFCMAMAAGFVQPAAAASSPRTRLVEFRSENCLLISGSRDNAASKVSVNGHIVPAEGRHNWRVRLPVSTVRSWSAPMARTVTVAVEGLSHEADLPIGLLGHADDLAMLVVRAK
ncbi:hypothetical protein H5V43_18090 [Sphingobium fuliginis]|uniref:Uncharacterized protein n=1 Tax=Sphingobium fuliginis (strain ATCC 27551) TaxID=336203 RepID=A0A7M2GNM8_SPHSA|nr:hypothetical protein [Sphingobium fuliginis]QOT74045.1 hypothetical protein H5V43_18090 [Sphingobium fuliginis]